MPKGYIRYFLPTLAIALVGLPVAASLGVVAAPAVPVVLGLLAARYARNNPQDTLLRQTLPVMLAFTAYMLLYSICLLAAGYSYNNEVFDGFFWANFLYLPYIFIMAFMGNYSLYPAMVLLVYLPVFIGMYVAGARSLAHGRWNKGVAVLLAVTVGLGGISAAQYAWRGSRFLGLDYRTTTVEETMRMGDYQPFGGTREAPLNEEPTLQISGDWPRMDGATAAWPVYTAMADMLYTGLDAEAGAEIVQCNTTADAYSRLLAGEVDVIFVTQPSAQHLALAEEMGVQLTLTPVAREAFVFLVNRQNPVNSLTLDEIRGIYLKKITNWLQVGGNNERILPFQRSANSGSQTVMEQVVMAGETLPEPLMEEYSTAMSGLITDIAAYRNYGGAIGYSFRYYAVGLEPSPGVKLLSVDGVTPSVENIRSGAYPFTVDVYAITAGEIHENTALLLEWCLSAQGQRLIEACGYVGIE